MMQTACTDRFSCKGNEYTSHCFKLTVKLITLPQALAMNFSWSCWSMQMGSLVVLTRHENNGKRIEPARRVIPIRFPLLRTDDP